MKLIKKIHNVRGETLIEILASIVIGSLSLALMFGCIMASTDMDKKAKALDKQHYANLTAADAREDAPTDAPVTTPTPRPGEVTITRKPLPDEVTTPSPAVLNITIYGENQMSSYRRE